MDKKLFELTNTQRRYLGLTPIEEHWTTMKLRDTYLYFDGDMIRKSITVTEHMYHEQELFEKTDENHTLLLPKTAKGKPKKLNYTAMQSFRLQGMHFHFQGNRIIIANYTTNTTYYIENFEKEKSYKDLNAWLEQWIEESTDQDVKEIDEYKMASRQHFRFQEGDFFAFKIGRRQWGFGRILLDVVKLRRRNDFRRQKHYGLNNLMFKPLIVKVYHKISDTWDIDIDELNGCMALPSQAIMDSGFFYGEFKIIGHKPLEDDENDMLISYGSSVSPRDKDTVYLQYGLIYKETTHAQYNKYLWVSDEHKIKVPNPYYNTDIDPYVHIFELNECIEANSNMPFWEHESSKWDLRNPKNADIKKEIFEFFGLNPEKSYLENWNHEANRKGK